MTHGFPVVLTADRTLIAGYPTLFDGMLTASQTTMMPRFLMERFLMPPAQREQGRALVAPLGLRRIEAALLAGGFSANDVAVVAPEDLAAAIGPATRVVGISTGEPAGRGMNTSTMTEIMGGMIYPEAMFRRLLRQVRRCLPAAPHAKVVLGGPGVWQLAEEDHQRLGIDHVVSGYAEGNTAHIMRTLLEGGDLPRMIPGEAVPVEAIPRIRHASTMGVIELSRGCGLGCEFCTIGRTPMRHLPEETILADAETNLAAGITSIAALSEDFFRYGADGMRVKPQALISLLNRLRELAQLRLIQIDHVNVISIAQYTDEELRATHDALVGQARHNYPWVNVGVETAAGELLKANGGAAKMGRYPAADWGALCAEQLRRLCRAGFFPLVSLVVGLPGEQDADVRATLNWVHALRDERLAIFPVFHAPIDGAPGIRARDLSRVQWELMRTSYQQNFRWIPKMYWDNQTGAGVPLAKRLLLQSTGRGQVPLWNGLFAWHMLRARR